MMENKTNKFDSDWKKSAISRKFPSYRNSKFISNESWLRGKQKDDEAEGLWRIHDNLYDFTDFVDRHPGGSFWLQQTKGTDITESFESHHISTLPDSMLAKFKVRAASKPRNYTLTMHENGFYKVLKSRVREKLKEVDHSYSKRTDLMHFGLLVATFLLSYLAVAMNSTVYGIFGALALSWLVISAHNYFHKKDNWQMYTFNLSLMNFTAWRISHALSHHVYPNSFHDLELSLFEPFLCWIPNPHIASKVQRVMSVLIQPVVYLLISPVQFATRLASSLKYSNVMYWHDIIGFILPAFMLLASKGPFANVLYHWLVILFVSNFIFGLIGLTAAHHDPQILHDGDASRKDRDWGLFQMDTIIDRGDIKGSQFLVLTHFGEHLLHHLFPTLDHGILPQLNPVLLKTLEEFNATPRECNHIDHLIGQNKQLLRTKPNPIPPDAKRK